MLIDEYTRLVKSVDFVSEEEAGAIIGTVLDNLRDHFSATVADVWRKEYGKNSDMLSPFVYRSDNQRPELLRFALSDDATGILPWVVEHRQPIWLEGIRSREPGAALMNRIGQEPVEGRYLDFYERTDSLMAVPVEYRGQVRGVLCLELSMSGRLSDPDVDTLKGLALPTGILIWKADAFNNNKKHTDDAIGSFRTVLTMPSAPLNPYRTGFVARPFTPEFERVGDLLRKAFGQHKIRATQYSHPPGGDIVIAEMLQQIASSHFGVADVTGLNHNVMIELGMVLALNKPFLVFRSQAEVEPLPFDVAGYQCYRYAIEGERMNVWEAGQGEARAVQEIVRDFVQNRLALDPAFQDAKEWIE